MDIVLDSSVLADIFVKSRSRHEWGRKLSDFIQKKDIKIIIPIHAILEVKSAIDNERLNPVRGEVSKEFFTEDSPLKIRTIPIDQKFLREYHNLNIPYIKAGDLIFILIAKKHGYKLITEDTNQSRVAKSIGIDTYTIEEFLNKYS